MNNELKPKTKTQLRREKRNASVIQDFQAMYDPAKELQPIVDKIADKNGVSYSTAYNLIYAYRESQKRILESL